LCAAVAGTTTPGTAGLLTATGTSPAIATTTWGSGWFSLKLTEKGGYLSLTRD